MCHEYSTDRSMMVYLPGTDNSETLNVDVKMGRASKGLSATDLLAAWYHRITGAALEKGRGGARNTQILN